MLTPTAKFGDLEGFVCIVTYGRSGSTLLQNLLNAFDGFCIRGENNNLLGPLAQSFFLAENSTNLRNLRKNQRVTTPEDPWYGGEHILPWRYGRNLAQIFLREVLAPPVGTRVAGLKEIRWGSDPRTFAHSMNFVRAFFPGARLIFNTRDHDEVCRSGWWADMDPAAVKKTLNQHEALFFDYMKKHPTVSTHVHYNDYVADPAALRPVFDALAQPWDPGLVQRVLDKKLTHLKDAEE